MSRHQMTTIERNVAYELIYAGCEPEPGRFTADLPINSEVWFAYWRGEFREPQELLLTPHMAAGTNRLLDAVSSRISHVDEQVRNSNAPGQGEPHEYLAANESHVLARIRFEDLLLLLPLTSWWQRYVSGPISQTQQVREVSAEIEQFFNGPGLCSVLVDQILKYVHSERTLHEFKKIGLTLAAEALEESPLLRLHPGTKEVIRRLLNVAALYGALAILDAEHAPEMSNTQVHHRLVPTLQIAFRRFADAVKEEPQRLELHAKDSSIRPPLWAVAPNRIARRALHESRKTVKADAAVRLFDTGGAGVLWAVIDAGIDATHPAFADLSKLKSTAQFSNNAIAPSLSRVVSTMDFTRFAAITSGRIPQDMRNYFVSRGSDLGQISDDIQDIAQSLRRGKVLDWARLEPYLRIEHDTSYVAPNAQEAHGTHVAGIIGANWRRDMYEKLNSTAGAAAVPVPMELYSGDICGVAPAITLLDLRVFKVGALDPDDKEADEFAILAALQYLRYLNQSKDRQYVHGVNLSLSLRHEVRSYACGSTPVCLECERLVGSGLVLVAAAGNYGYDEDYSINHLGGSYRAQSITDPGNSPSVITVGSTHRTDPYQYGISYFSSHGPTGDGREKPDLVAPGEKILSTAPGVATAERDGTSMAAPHVSGVAALLLARNKELMGHPGRIKEVLCRTASDLGRGKLFQGAGLVDALRALQAV